MLRHLTEWFKDIAGIWMVIGILTVTLLVFSAAKHFGFTANSKISSINQELNDLSFEKYNGINLTGSEVINAIKRYQEELPVTVYTGESVDTYQGKFRPSNNSRKSEKYIKPSQVYTGSLLKDADKEIVGLVFAKEGILLTDTSYKELLAKIVGANSEESTMDSLIQQINNMLSNRNETITTLTQKVASLNTTVSSLQSQNNTLSTRVTSLNSQVTSLNGKISTANTKYSTLLNEVSSGKSIIASAITNKSVSASESDSFSTMAAKISNITTEGLLSEQYSYSNDSIKNGIGLQLTVTTQNIVPKFAIITSDIGYMQRIIVSTCYSKGDYSFTTSTAEICTTCAGSIVFNNSQVTINITPNNYWQGWYSLVSGGTTSLTVYGIKK